MDTFFANLDPTLRIYWYLAIGSSLIFVVQTIMTFMGSDSDSLDANFDGDFDVSEQPFQLFSFRNLVNFLLGFSWTGVSLYGVIQNDFLLILVAFLVGATFVALFFAAMKAMLKLAEDNSFKLEETLGKTGDVYLPIPPIHEGKGKVMISTRGSVHELDAVNSTSDRLKTGCLVRVVSIEGNVLVVEPVR